MHKRLMVAAMSLFPMFDGVPSLSNMIIPEPFAIWWESEQLM